MLPGLLVSLLTLTSSPAAPELAFRFLGNAGFEISDGETTLLIDFPYRSGASGYMTFDREELRPRENALCVFTHRHADHFEPAALDQVGCSVAGPAEVMARVDEGRRRPGAASWRFGAASVLCLPSEHGGVDHCSYLLDWGGKAILILGDVEKLAADLLEHERLDMVFLPYWLASEAPQVRTRFPGAEIILYHHPAGEGRPECEGCRFPSQGETFGR